MNEVSGEFCSHMWRVKEKIFKISPDVHLWCEMYFQILRELRGEVDGSSWSSSNIQREWKERNKRWSENTSKTYFKNIENVLTELFLKTIFKNTPIRDRRWGGGAERTNEGDSVANKPRGFRHKGHGKEKGIATLIWCKCWICSVETGKED